MLSLFVGLSVSLLGYSGVEMRLARGYPLVEAMVNGKGPFLMLVDTGASSCVLTPEAAQVAGLKYTSRTVLVSALGEQVVPVAEGTLVRVGDWEERNVEVLASVLTGVKKVDAKIDGILGQAFLSRMEVMVDYSALRLRLGDEARETSSGWGHSRAMKLMDGRMTVLVRTGDRSLHLILDSGASDLVLSCRDDCGGVARPIGAGELVTSAGKQRVARILISSVAVGTAKWKDVIAVLAPQLPSTSIYDGLLPAQWFGAVYMDSARGEIKLRSQ